MLVVMLSIFNYFYFLILLVPFSQMIYLGMRVQRIVYYFQIIQEICYFQ